MMTPVRTGVGALDAVAETVSTHFESMFATVEEMRAVVAGLFEEGPVDAARLEAAVHPLALDLLARGYVLGSGFVAAPHALSDRALHLAWWQGDTQQLLGQSAAPAGDPFDYTKREWFRVPEATGRRHVTGPYVDYVCSDEYVVTSTQPVVVREQLVGVVGADQLVESLEDLLLGALSAAGATLVSEHGRVIASADHRLAPGSVVTLDDSTVPCGTLPLAVVSAHLA